MALGINNIMAVSGMFIGLVVGGLLAPIDWRLVFIVSAPFGVVGTAWAYLKLKDNGVRTPARIDWWGNVLFAVGLTSILVGITYGIEPYQGSAMGWANPKVIGELGGGAALLVAFMVVERFVAQPMLRLELFRIRAFLFGNLAALLAAIGRGGLMFLLVIWLQGIWLPLHGYSFSATPLWAGIYMLPMTAGVLIAGPISGILSDRYGARPFATTGMAVAALSFIGFALLPINFWYPEFAGLMLVNGLAMGLFASPNRAAIMNSLPPDQRGVGAGMSGAFQNAAIVLSMGIFFSLMISGISSMLPRSLYRGLVAHQVPVATATTVSHLPPITSLFASLLGYNPIKNLVPGQSWRSYPPSQSPSSAVATSSRNCSPSPSLMASPSPSPSERSPALSPPLPPSCAVASTSTPRRQRRHQTAAAGAISATLVPANGEGGKGSQRGEPRRHFERATIGSPRRQQDHRRERSRIGKRPQQPVPVRTDESAEARTCPWASIRCWRETIPGTTRARWHRSGSGVAGEPCGPCQPTSAKRSSAARRRASRMSSRTAAPVFGEMQANGAPIVGVDLTADEPGLFRPRQPRLSANEARCRDGRRVRSSVAAPRYG